MNMTETSEAKTYTEAQALDEAVLLFVRKMRRLYTDAYTDVIRQLPDGAREALNMADVRADRTRVSIPAGSAQWPTAFEEIDEEEELEQIANHEYRRPPR